MTNQQAIDILLKECEKQTSIGKYILAAAEDEEMEVLEMLELRWQAYDRLWYFIEDLRKESPQWVD